MASEVLGTLCKQAYVGLQGVPTNELHACGYVSIGCEPCTRAVLPNQHEREGRWWWEDATGKECGLHSGNVVASAAEQAQQEAMRDLWDDDSNVQQLSHDDLASLLEGHRYKSTVVVMYAPWCQYSQVRNILTSLCRRADACTLFYLSTMQCFLLLASSLAEALPCATGLLLVVMMRSFVVKKASQELPLRARLL